MFAIAGEKQLLKSEKCEHKHGLLLETLIFCSGAFILFRSPSVCFVWLYSEFSKVWKAVLRLCIDAVRCIGARETEREREEVYVCVLLLLLLFDWCCSQRTWIKLTDSFGDFHMADHLFVLSLVVFKFNCWKKSVFRYHIMLLLLSVTSLSVFSFQFCSFNFPVGIVRWLYIVCCRRWLNEGSGNKFAVC